MRKLMIGTVVSQPASSSVGDVRPGASDYKNIETVETKCYGRHSA